MKMKKKVVIIVLVIVVILLVLSGIIIFTDAGQGVRTFLYEQFELPKETVEISNLEQIKITYKYDDVESFDITTDETELLKMIEELSNKKLVNYSSTLMLAVLGTYTVDLDNNIQIQFDNYDKDGYVRIIYKDKSFLTKINPEILEKVIEIVDQELTERTKIFQTDKVTLSQKDNTNKIEITEKTAVDYILEQCKNVYIKEINYLPSIVTPDYELDFNNDIILAIYKDNAKGWLLKDGILSEAYRVDTFENIIKNALQDNQTKREMFATDKITIEYKNKSIEITDNEQIEKITTPLIYSDIATPSWLEDHDITEEYNGGIKVKINNYEYLIPGKKGDVTIGNRYIISQDGEIILCFPLKSIDSYINELLGIEVEQAGGATVIAIPSDE